MPDLIGRALVHNASAVIGAQEKSIQITELKSELLHMQGQLVAATNEVQELQASMHHLEESSRARGIHNRLISCTCHWRFTNINAQCRQLIHSCASR